MVGGIKQCKTPTHSGTDLNTYALVSWVESHFQVVIFDVLDLGMRLDNKHQWLRQPHLIKWGINNTAMSIHVLSECIYCFSHSIILGTNVIEKKLSCDVV